MLEDLGRVHLQWPCVEHAIYNLFETLSLPGCLACGFVDPQVIIIVIEAAGWRLGSAKPSFRPKGLGPNGCLDALLVGSLPPRDVTIVI